MQLTNERSDVLELWNFDEEKISRAAAFITDCSRDKRCAEMPTSVELP